jgi:hypothetical protein
MTPKTLRPAPVKSPRLGKNPSAPCPIQAQGASISPAPVAFDAAVLYLLCRLGGWPGLSAEDVEAGRQALLSAKLDKAGTELKALAATGMPDAVVPFQREELDVACAAILADICGPCELDGDGLLVDAGFFRVRQREVDYVDEADDTRGSEPRLLHPPALDALLQTLRTWPSRPVRYWVPGVNEGANARGSEVLRVIGTWVAPTLAQVQNPKVTLRLLRPGDPKRGAVTLCEVECVQHHCDLVLRNLRTEWLMELQAASLDGAWLQMEHTRFNCLGPLPDLLEPGDGRDIWWHPAGMFQPALGVLPLAAVGLDPGTARRIVQRVPWAWIHRPSEHFTAATGAP